MLLGLQGCGGSGSHDPELRGRVSSLLSPCPCVCLRPTRGSRDVCLCCQRITELLRLHVFPSPSAALCVLLCNQKPLKPDVLIYNSYIGKQSGLLSCCSESTFTSSLLPKEGLGEKSQGSGRSLLFLPSHQVQLSACGRSHKGCEPSLILIPNFN